jgi:predicted nucleotidyltransferase
MEIEKIIKSKLSEIEEKLNVKILYAVESGSRAWGFASDDSDYDVRFIYARPLEDYLKLEKIRDVIDYELNDIYDINGWDLKKFLTLLHDSNPVIFEWAQSPIVYKSTDDWNKISSIVNEFAQLKKLLYHYLSMAVSNYKTHFISEYVSYKKYFYVLRPILCCQWILKKNSIPPILFDDLVKELFPENLKLFLDKLLEIKKSSSEKKEGKRFPELDDFIERSFVEIENEVATLQSGEKHSFEKLNKVFLEILMGE